MELAKTMFDLTPPSEADDAAIKRIVANVPADQRDIARKGMTDAFEYGKFHDFVVKTMADTFTVAELKKMIAYHSSPEAASIAKKMPDYEAKVQPQLLRMLDVALMITRTGKGPDYKAPPSVSK
jgi:hypothetical protein